MPSLFFLSSYSSWHNQASSSFVKLNGHQLTQDGSPFYFMGANAYWLIDTVQSDPQRIDSFFALCNSYSLKVIRTWAFNHKMPSSWGNYDEGQFRGLDYIIASASKHNIKLILSLGNTWSAYRSPEEMMKIAGIDPNGKTLLDYYSSPQVSSLYQSHIKSIVTRVNTVNGLVYSDDPAIMMWDLINEPRCPGCTSPSQQSVVQGWISSMSSYLKSLVANQLVSPGTEGYLMNDSSGGSSDVRWNPGAGAACEGEDWVAIGRMKSIDVLVGHFYERQMESVPPSWEPCGWACFTNFNPQYIAKHREAAEGIGKPFIIEEFGLLLQSASETQRAATFQHFYDSLIKSKKEGGSLVGVMFWSAAIGDVSDDGYNVYLDVASHALPPSSSGSSPSTSGLPQSQPTSQPAPARAPIRDNKEGLDYFRMGGAREACSEAAAKWWIPLWFQTSSISSPSATQSSISDALLQRVKGMTTQQVISQAGRDLSS